MDEGPRSVDAQIDAAIPSADFFFRSEPASDEMSSDARRVALQVVDFGCALFRIGNNVRPNRRVRDLVVSALLRRTVITLEGVRTLVFAGLLEPAFASARTLQDIELALKLILRDESDEKAHALAGMHYLQYKRHGEGMLKSKSTREEMLGSADRIDEVRTVAKNYSALLESSVFDGVRASLKGARAWHGYDRTEDAFAAIGQDADYFMTYDSASWFVHASNVDHDIVDGSGPQIAFRPFVERDPTRYKHVLGLALLKSLELFELIIKDKGIDLDGATGGGATVTIAGKVVERIGSLDALRGLVMQEFKI